MKILITAGATREPIDSIRYITNFSTGQTGASLTDYFIQEGHEVTHLCGIGAVEPQMALGLKIQRFESFSDLDQQFKELLFQTPFDVIIQSAAVSDFTPTTQYLEKIDSNQTLQLELRPNPKLILLLRSYIKPAFKQPVIVGFKLTHTPDLVQRENSIFKLSLQPEIDFVVHNDFSELQNRKQHQFNIYQKRNLIEKCIGTQKLAERLKFLIQRRSEL